MKKRIMSILTSLSIVFTLAAIPFNASADSVSILPIGTNYVIPSAVIGVDSTSRLNVRSGPGTGYSSIDKLPYNSHFAAFVNSTSTYNTTNGGSSWTYIKYTKSGQQYSGWISKEYVNFKPYTGSWYCGVVTNVTADSTLNVRESASTSSTIVGKLAPAAIVNVIGKTTDGWYKIRYDCNKTGYVSGSFLSPVTQMNISSPY